MNLFPLHTLVEHYDASHINRLFVVGDLHGCYDIFMYQLQLHKFNFKHDLVISVGDLIDRGPNSLKCLKLVSEPWFKAIRGNHEQMCLEATLATEMQAFHCRHGGEWLYVLPNKIQQECVQLCLDLPVVLEVNFKNKKFGFIHADININNWHDLKKKILIDDYFSDEYPSILQNVLWGRSRISHGSKNNKYQNVVGIDEIYLGHTVVKHPTRIQNCFYIDTGLVFGNSLTIKELN